MVTLALSVATLLFAIGSFMLMIRAHRMAGRIIIVATLIATLPTLLPVFDAFLQAVPLWLKVTASLLVSLVCFQLALSLIVGSDVANRVTAGILLEVLGAPVRLVATLIRRYFSGI